MWIGITALGFDPIKLHFASIHIYVNEFLISFSMITRYWTPAACIAKVLLDELVNEKWKIKFVASIFPAPFSRYRKTHCFGQFILTKWWGVRIMLHRNHFNSQSIWVKVKAHCSRCKPKNAALKRPACDYSSFVFYVHVPANVRTNCLLLLFPRHFFC